MSAVKSIWSRVGAATVASAIVAAMLVTLHPSVFAQSASEHWVGTWATAEVARPQTPPAPAPALPPFMANQCPTPPAPAVPPVAPLFATHLGGGAGWPICSRN